MHNVIEVMEEVEQYSVCTQTEREYFKSLEGTLVLFLWQKQLQDADCVQSDCWMFLSVHSGYNLNFDPGTTNTIELKCFYPVQEGLI